MFPLNGPSPHKLRSPNKLSSHSSKERGSNPIIIFVALLCTFSSSSISFLRHGEQSLTKPACSQQLANGCWCQGRGFFALWEGAQAVNMPHTGFWGGWGWRAFKVPDSSFSQMGPAQLPLPLLPPTLCISGEWKRAGCWFVYWVGPAMLLCRDDSYPQWSLPPSRVII